MSKVLEVPVAPGNAPEFQLRVYAEANELTTKLEALDKFTVSKFFKTVPEDEQFRLEAQLVVMVKYLSILVDRINNFKTT